MKRFMVGSVSVFVLACVWALTDHIQAGRLTMKVGMLLAIKLVVIPVIFVFVTAMATQLRCPLKMLRGQSRAFTPLLCGPLVGFLALVGTAIVLCAPLPPQSDALILALATWLATKAVLRVFGRPRVPGRCAHCGYDISGSLNFGRCPECGGPLHETLGFLEWLPIPARVVAAAVRDEAPCDAIAVNLRR